MLGKGGAGSDTTADLLAVMDAAITAVPPKHRRLMVTCDSARASHGLITRLDELSARINHYPWLEPHKLVALEPPTTPVRRAAAVCWLMFPPHRLPGREADRQVSVAQAFALSHRHARHGSVVISSSLSPASALPV